MMEYNRDAVTAKTPELTKLFEGLTDLDRAMVGVAILKAFTARCASCEMISRYQVAANMLEVAHALMNLRRAEDVEETYATCIMAMADEIASERAAARARIVQGAGNIVTLEPKGRA